MCAARPAPLGPLGKSGGGEVPFAQQSTTPPPWERATVRSGPGWRAREAPRAPVPRAPGWGRRPLPAIGGNKSSGWGQRPLPPTNANPQGKNDNPHKYAGRHISRPARSAKGQKKIHPSALRAMRLSMGGHMWGEWHSMGMYMCGEQSVIPIRIRVTEIKKRPACKRVRQHGGALLCCLS